MMKLQEKMRDYKISKKMIKAFYGISYPTLRKRLRDKGLTDFIGRRKFLFAEFLLIFKALGQPQEITAELSELQLIYEQLLQLGLLKGASQKDLPEKKSEKSPPQPKTNKLLALKTPLALFDRFLMNYYQVLMKAWEILSPTVKNYRSRQAA
ncbi:hypothetical protein [Saprospira grandis]|nr:hypothetical protein [Saprospira grandis]